MKLPRWELMLNAGLMLAGSVYLLVQLPKHQERFRPLSIALAIVAAVLAVLVLARSRFAPGLFAILMMFMVGWGAYFLFAEGYEFSTMMTLAVGVVCLIWGYPQLRQLVREGEPLPLEASSQSHP